MLVQIAPPAEEPVSLAQAKLHLRVDGTDEDTLITTLIAAARRHAEALTGRSFVTQDWRLVLDGFDGCVELERGAVQQILSFNYRDTSGTTRTVAWDAASGSLQRSSDGELVADLSAAPARISPAFGRAGPIVLPEAGALTIEYRAGYGNAASVPEGIKAWILLRVGTLYANREDVAAGIVSPLPHVDAMLDDYSIVLA